MPLLPISLGVRRDLWLKADRRPAETEPDGGEDLRARVLARDEHICQYCGFQSFKYQETNPKNGDIRDARLDNLVTACIFCQQCFALEQVAQMRSGVLIWMPEIGQAALHHIARAIFVARRSQGPMAEAARVALDVLRGRRDEVVRRLGSDDPGIVGAVMADLLEDRDYDQRDRKLNGVRLLPLDRRIVRDGELEFDQFPQILAYWRSKNGPFGSLLPSGWGDLLAQVKKAA